MISLSLLWDQALFSMHWFYGIVAFAFCVKAAGILNQKYLEWRLGAKPPVNVESDWLLGLLVGYRLIKNKNDGTLNEYNRLAISRCKYPSVNTFKRKLFGVERIVTQDPENIKAISVIQFDDFDLGNRHYFFKPFLGSSVFTLDGEKWKHARGILRPQFLREQISRVTSLEPHVQYLAKHIKNTDGNNFDIGNLFLKFTVDSATDFLFDEPAGALRDDNKGALSNNTAFGGAEFANALEYAQNIVAKRIMLQNLLVPLDDRKFKSAVQLARDYTNHYISKALNATPQYLETYSKDRYVFLYELVKKTRDPLILRDQLLSMLAAGRDSTATLLTFTVYELARNPHVWSRLKQEVYQTFGQGEDSQLDAITFETLKRCTYVKAVISEALRMYPPLSLNSRSASRTTTIPRGGGKDGTSPLLVKKGQTVNYSVYALHRDPAFWGEDSMVFNPDRWLEERTLHIGWAYLPFGGGPRTCLGQQFVLTEVSYVIVRLAQLFPQLWSDELGEEYPPKMAVNLVLGPYGKVLVRMKE